MIKIYNKNLKSFSLYYYNAIKNFVNRKGSHNKIDKLNKLVNKYFQGKSFEDLITGEPYELKKFVDLWNNNKNNKKRDFHFFLTLYNYLNQDIIFYRKELLKEIDFDVCPYCNRNFIYDVDKTRLSEFDHYFPKSKYPFLAISFFNLIPVCKTCNHIKKEKTDPIINPYDDTINFNEIKFEMELKKINEINIKLSTNNSSLTLLVDNHNMILKIDELYNYNKNYIKELVLNRLIYNETYINEILTKYGDRLNFTSKNDIIDIVINDYQSDSCYKRKPYSKMSRDLCDELFKNK